MKKLHTLVTAIPVVAAVGVKNLVIIDTDDAVLVADRDRSQQVKLVVEQLRASNHPAAALHNTVHRPWGSYTILEDKDDCKVKRLTVRPGHVLSLQLHHRRSEHWTVVHGTAKVRVGATSPVRLVRWKPIEEESHGKSS